MKSIDIKQRKGFLFNQFVSASSMLAFITIYGNKVEIDDYGIWFK